MSDEPVLRVPESAARAQLQARIDAGENLSSEHKPLRNVDELDARQREFYTWDEFNRALLKRLFSGPIMDHYRTPITLGVGSNPAARLRRFEEDLATHLRQLRSIIERLPLWTDDSVTAEGSPLGRSGVVSSTGPIFVVHGHNEGRKAELARLLERSTDREVIVLHEKANRGRMLLEKFEAHAAEVSFAVVLLTADDEGRVKGATDLRLRGRQNVIFEMGFFFALLGRERVVVLLDEGVEEPSDVRGLVYEPLDTAGSWKHTLARELEAAGITVDRSRIV